MSRLDERHELAQSVSQRDVLGRIQIDQHQVVSQNVRPHHSLPFVTLNSERLLWERLTKA